MGNEGFNGGIFLEVLSEFINFSFVCHDLVFNSWFPEVLKNIPTLISLGRMRFLSLNFLNFRITVNHNSYKQKWTKIHRLIVSKSDNGALGSLFELLGKILLLTFTTPFVAGCSREFCFLFDPRPKGKAKSCGNFRMIFPDVMRRPNPS